MAAYSPARLDMAYERIVTVCCGVSSKYAEDIQPRMRANAQWNDRNGPSMTGKNARQSLEAEAGLMDDRSAIQIVARSTRQTRTAWRGWDGAPVGAFLELGTRKMRRRAVIWPTLQATAPVLKTQLEDALRPDV